MARRVCLHGHCYQPDRTDPWTGAVEADPSAAPFHDWNERITAECYDPGLAAGNFRRTSFNFGPTLMAWLAEDRRRRPSGKDSPGTCARILEADRAGRERFGGHGPAIAQSWGHSILPLDSEQDRRTQVRWGARDFESRFGRPAEGMWLPETAVDIPTLEALARAGMRFTILAPHQVRARPGAYRCRLPSGSEIALFAYDGAIANEIAFQGLLADGERMAGRLLSVEDDFVSIATDGETYGHHQRGGEVALARCLDRLEAEGVRLTVFAEELDRHPPTEQAGIVENSSWSCIHGVERWRAACGCGTGLHHGWRLDWRGPLRSAVEWLRDVLGPLFEEHLAPLVTDPWALRDDYIEAILDPSSLAALLDRHAGRALGPADRALAAGLLEMQRRALLSFASCGWFFDDISEPATVQVIRSAGRAIQLCREHTGTRLEEGFTDILHNARSNIPELGTGADIYRRFVCQEPRTRTGSSRDRA